MRSSPSKANPPAKTGEIRNLTRKNTIQRRPKASTVAAEFAKHKYYELDATQAAKTEWQHKWQPAEAMDEIQAETSSGDSAAVPSCGPRRRRPAAKAMQDAASCAKKCAG